MAAARWNMCMCQNMRILKIIYILLFTLSIYLSEIKAIQDGCTIPESCITGETLPDPSNCNAFYNCSPSGTYEHKQCNASRGVLKQYDVRQKRCRVPEKAQCAPPCSQPPTSAPAPHSPTATKTSLPTVSTRGTSAETLLLDKRVGSGDDTHAEGAQNAPMVAVTISSGMGTTTSKIKPVTQLDTDETDGITVDTDMESNDTDVATVKNPPINDTNVHNVPTVKSGLQTTEESQDMTTIPITSSTTLPTTSPTTPTTTTTTTTTTPTTTPTTTTTTTTSTTTTIETTTTVDLTTSSSTEAPVIPATDPPYVVLTSTTSPTNASVVAPPKDRVSDEGVSMAMIGVAAAIVVLMLAVIVGAVVIIVLLRRRRARRGHDIPKVENPEYAVQSDPRDYRFSRDSTLHVGPTVNFQLLNNNGKTPGGDSSGENSLRKKKRPAPVPPSARNQHLLRRKGQAPTPPNPFGHADTFDPDQRAITDIYEVDSHSSKEDLELSTFTSGKKKSVVNENAKIPEAHDDKSDSSSDSENEDTVTEPLLSTNKTHKPSEDNVNEEDVVTFPPTSTFKPIEDKKKDLNKSTEIVWDDYDKENNPFCDS